MIEGADRRDAFLMAWYRELWRNIDRSMTSVWQIVGPIALVGAAFAYQGVLGATITFALQVVIVLWGINNVIDMNQWHRRNLLFASRVEAQLLREADYGIVIPREFKTPPPDWIHFYKINVATFVALSAVVAAVYAHSLYSVHPGPWAVAGITSLIVSGFCFTLHTYRRCERQNKRCRRGLGLCNENPQLSAGAASPRG